MTDTKQGIAVQNAVAAATAIVASVYGVEFVQSMRGLDTADFQFLLRALLAALVYRGEYRKPIQPDQVLLVVDADDDATLDMSLVSQDEAVKILADIQEAAAAAATADEDAKEREAAASAADTMQKARADLDNVLQHPTEGCLPVLTVTRVAVLVTTLPPPDESVTSTVRGLMAMPPFSSKLYPTPAESDSRMPLSASPAAIEATMAAFARDEEKFFNPPLSNKELDFLRGLVLEMYAVSPFKYQSHCLVALVASGDDSEPDDSSYRWVELSKLPEWLATLAEKAPVFHKFTGVIDEASKRPIADGHCRLAFWRRDGLHILSVLREEDQRPMTQSLRDTLRNTALSQTARLGMVHRVFAERGCLEIARALPAGDLPNSVFAIDNTGRIELHNREQVYRKAAEIVQSAGLQHGPFQAFEKPTALGCCRVAIPAGGTAVMLELRVHAVEAAERINAGGGVA